MIDSWMDLLGPWGPAVAVLVAGALLGWVGRTVVFRRLRTLAQRTATRADDLFIEASNGLWFVAAVFAAALPANRLAPMPDDTKLVVERIALSLLLFVLTLFASRFVGLWFSSAEREPGQVHSQPSLIAKAARTAVLLAGTLLVLDNAGVEIKTLLTVAGVGSLAIGLALQPTLANFFAGLHLSMSKPIRVGDFIELEDGTQGEVVDISWRTTRIRQMANNMVVVPNARLVDMRLINYTLPVPTQSTLVAVGVAYDSDLALVERVTVEVANQVMRELDEGDKEFEPVIRYHTFGDSSINFNVVLRARAITDRFLLVHEFVKRLKARYDAEGIEIPFPQRVVHLPGGAAPEPKAQA